MLLCKSSLSISLEMPPFWLNRACSVFESLSSANTRLYLHLERCQNCHWEFPPQPPSFSWKSSRKGTQWKLGSAPQSLTFGYVCIVIATPNIAASKWISTSALCNSLCKVRLPANDSNVSCAIDRLAVLWNTYRLAVKVWRGYHSWFPASDEAWQWLHHTAKDAPPPNSRLSPDTLTCSVPVSIHSVLCQLQNCPTSERLRTQWCNPPLSRHPSHFLFLYERLSSFSPLPAAVCLLTPGGGTPWSTRHHDNLQLEVDLTHCLTQTPPPPPAALFPRPPWQRALSVCVRINTSWPSSV